jgi:hypothetical protein
VGHLCVGDLGPAVFGRWQIPREERLDEKVADFDDQRRKLARVGRNRADKAVPRGVRRGDERDLETLKCELDRGNRQHLRAVDVKGGGVLEVVEELPGVAAQFLQEIVECRGIFDEMPVKDLADVANRVVVRHLEGELEV